MWRSNDSGHIIVDCIYGLNPNCPIAFFSFFLFSPAELTAPFKNNSSEIRNENKEVVVVFGVPCPWLAVESSAQTPVKTAANLPSYYLMEYLIL